MNAKEPSNFLKRTVLELARTVKWGKLQGKDFRNSQMTATSKSNLGLSMEADTNL